MILRVVLGHKEVPSSGKQRAPCHSRTMTSVSCQAQKICIEKDLFDHEETFQKATGPLEEDTGSGLKPSVPRRSQGLWHSQPISGLKLPLGTDYAKCRQHPVIPVPQLSKTATFWETGYGSCPSANVAVAHLPRAPSGEKCKLPLQSLLCSHPDKDMRLLLDPTRPIFLRELMSQGSSQPWRWWGRHHRIGF